MPISPRPPADISRPRETGVNAGERLSLDATGRPEVAWLVYADGGQEWAACYLGSRLLRRSPGGECYVLDGSNGTTHRLLVPADVVDRAVAAFPVDTLPPWPELAPLLTDHRVGVHQQDRVGVHQPQVVGDDERRVVSRPASAIVPAPVRWAWKDRVPLAASTLLAGREGVGKGAFATDLMARWSRGQLAGDLRGEPVDVAIMSIEDDPERVLVPRLTAAGADLDRCHLLSASLSGLDSPLALPADVAGLKVRLREIGARVLVVDVPNAFMAGGFDSHKDHDVRQAVAGPLTLLATALDAAVVLIVHLNRAPSTVVLDRIAGSLGLSRASRSVLAVVENPDAEAERLLVLAKSNLGRLEVPSLRFRIEGAEVATPTGPASAGCVVHLGEAPAVTARNALQVSDTEDRTARDEAREWLTDLLGVEPLPAAQVKALAAKAGLSWSTVRRAKTDVGVESKRWGRPGEEGGWCWALSAHAEGAHETPNVPTLNTWASSPPDEHLHEAEPW